MICKQCKKPDGVDAARRAEIFTPSQRPYLHTNSAHVRRKQ